VTGVQTCALPIYALATASDELYQRRWIRDEIVSIDSLVTKKEKVYGTISLVIGITAYLLSFILVFGFFIAPFVLLTTFITHGLFVGWIKSSSVRISDEQLPELNSMIEEICRALAMPVPAVYVTNG